MNKTKNASSKAKGFPNELFLDHQVWDGLFSRFRIITRKLGIITSLHLVRQIIHFGPWRVVPKYLIRKARSVMPSGIEKGISLLPAMNPPTVSEEIRKNSVAVAGVLPAEFVDRLKRLTDRLPPNEYFLVHEVVDDVKKITQDENINRVLREYFKCEPELLEASLFVSKSEQGSAIHEQNLFHFDYAGWESLNVFVYLTDVTEISSYHVVARGSHKKIGVIDVLRGPLSPEDGLRRFGSSIFEIQGPAGTVFFENTEAFHRRHKGSGKRVMLNLLYASHRSLLSHGRASKADIEMRNRIFEEVRD